MSGVRGKVAMMAMAWWAFLDESIREQQGAAGAYVIAAVVMREPDLVDVREAVRGLGRRRRRFHWRVEEPKDQARAVRLVAGLPVTGVVVVVMSMVARKQERARRIGLERMLWELEGMGVQMAVMERRTRQLDAADVRTVDQARSQHQLRRIQLDHGDPDTEPLLWAADAVAGATRASIDGNPTHRTVLAENLTVHHVDYR
ncbi:MAG: hypothetical protein ACRCYU_02645 [Nocardioides sp.]